MAGKIQLYSAATPNGQKVAIALEELGLEYDAHFIDFRKGVQFEEPFVSINPNSKIPAIVDPNGPGGKSITLSESGAILLYLAEKTGKLLPSDPVLKWETIQWLFFQMAGVGPMFGQFGHFFVYGGKDCGSDYPIERYTKEAKRLLGVIEKRLEGRQYIVDETYTIADIAIWPWVSCLVTFYKAQEKLELASFPNTMAWCERCKSRPKSEIGMKVTPFT